MPFTIQITPAARDHLKALSKRDQQIIVDAIRAQLTDRADQPTRNRKRLSDNPLAPWELRIGVFRVFYDIIAVNQRVIVVAVGQKTHNVLRIGGDEVQL
ncbi:MAG: type II toxin-antitoxin system RelE/ParE family toxin [Planctomycetia bacterium]|nr:type II toxin-antitoxin system RelE/ParE family toxin [Planctomycetia bacterium]